MSAATSMETQIAELEKQTARLKSALSRGAWVTRLLLLGVLAFLGIVGYVLYREYQIVRSEKYVDELKTLAGQAYTKNSKEINGEFEKVGTAVQPLATKALEEQWAKDQPKFSKKLADEGAEFQKDIQAKLTERLNQHYEKALQELRDTLKAEVPELAKDEAKLKRVQDALIVGMHRMVEERGTKRLGKGFGAVSANWDKLPAAPARKNAADMETHWKLLGHALEIFYQVGTQPDAISKISDAAGAPLLRPGAAPAKPAPAAVPPAPAAGR